MAYGSKEYIEARNNPDDYFYCDACGVIIMVEDMDLDNIKCQKCGAGEDAIEFFEG